MTHSGVWGAIDTVAYLCGKTPSALARACGMDATAFNHSKRWDRFGKPRWPSCKTLARVIEVANITNEEFGRILTATENAEK